MHSGHSAGPGTCGSVGWNQDKSGKKGCDMDCSGPSISAVTSMDQSDFDSIADDHGGDNVVYMR